MKKFILILIVSLGGILSAKAQNIPELKFEEETHDFGKISQNRPVTFDFRFTNTGNEPLIISAAEPTCGCVIADFTKTPVLRGQSGKITVTYNAAVAGTFAKSVTVKSNARTPVKVLYVKGEVVPKIVE